MYSPYYVAPYATPYTNKPYKFNYLNPNMIGSIKTETHKLNNYPFNGQINFYDPVTGRPGPSVSMMPQVQTYSSHPYGLNVDIYGDPEDVEKAEKLLRKKNGGIDDDDDDELNIIDHKKRNKKNGLNYANTGNFKLMGDYLVHDSLVTSYIGAGIVLLEVIDGVKTIMLGCNSKGVYDDFGGGITFVQTNYSDTAYSLEKSASNGAASKTANLLWLSSSLKGIPNTDIKLINNELYKFYFVEIKGLSKLLTTDLTSFIENNSSVLEAFGKNNAPIKKKLARFNYIELSNLANSQVWEEDEEVTINDIDGNKDLKINKKIIAMMQKLKNKNVFGDPTQVTIHQNYNGNDGYTKIEI